MCLICIGLGYKKTLKYNSLVNLFTLFDEKKQSNMLSSCDFHVEVWFSNYGKVGNTTQSREIDFGKNEQGDGKFRAGRREMRENEQGEGR